MSEEFFQRLSRVFGWMALAVLFGWTVLSANIEIKDLDLWLHIGTGRYIVQHNFQVPAVDVLSHTIAGRPWNNHEWLFQIIVYLLHSTGGVEALLDMQVVLVAVAMAVLLILGYDRNKQMPCIFFLLLVAIVFQSRFTTRPDLFSLMFFAFYILILSFFLDRKWALFAVLVIQTLWTNIHGFFFFGPLFVAIGLTAEFCKRHVPLPYEWNSVGRLTDDEYARLKWILVAAAVACFINPQGVHGAVYPLQVMFSMGGESKIFFEKIVELQRPISWDTLFNVGRYPFYKLMLALSFISFLFNRRRVDISALIFWLVFLVFSLSAVRNLIFFAFAAYLVFVTNASSLSIEEIFPIRITDRKFVHLTSAVAKFLLIFWILHQGSGMFQRGYFDFEAFERKSEIGGIAQRNYPIKAVDFLVEQQVEGNFYNDFNTGAYLIGRTHPRIKVFIDGRTEVYGPDFFKYYQRIWEKDDSQEFGRMLEKYQVTGALLNSIHGPIPEGALQVLNEDKSWIPVYFDYDGVIFLKDVPQNQRVIEEFGFDFADWTPEPFDLRRLGAVNLTPYQHANRGFTLHSLGYNDKVLAESNEAIRMMPAYGVPYRLRGKVFAERKNFQKAFEDFRVATVFAPGNKSSRRNMVMAYYDLGDYDYVVREAGKMLERWPGDPDALFLMAKAYVQLEKYDRVERIWHRLVHPKLPSDIKALLEIGKLLQEREQFALALKMYEDLLAANDKVADLYLALGQVYDEMGEPEQAREMWEKGLTVDPEHKELRAALEDSQPQASTHDKGGASRGRTFWQQQEK